MKKYKFIIILVNCIVILFLFNRSVAKKESLLKNGRLVLLQLAPVDPRSLMQGDYMRLRYAIAGATSADSVPNRGYYVLRMNDSGVAQKVRVQEHKQLLNSEELLIAYKSGEWDKNIGAESFFFQEGEAEKYASARYGGLRV
ncbi:MAG: hypothetical protein EOO04_32885, partial [Chitinophagaceae bacterium]